MEIKVGFFHYSKFWQNLLSKGFVVGSASICLLNLDTIFHKMLQVWFSRALFEQTIQSTLINTELYETLCYAKCSSQSLRRLKLDWVSGCLRLRIFCIFWNRVCTKRTEQWMVIGEVVYCATEEHISRNCYWTINLTECLFSLRKNDSKRRLRRYKIVNTIVIPLSCAFLRYFFTAFLRYFITLNSDTFQIQALIMHTLFSLSFSQTRADASVYRAWGGK